MYGNGFTCANKITLKNLNDYHKNIPGKIYQESLEKDKTLKLEFTKR